MGLSKTIWANPVEFLKREQPVAPVRFFAPMALQARARRLVDGFAGLVAYGLPGNADEAVLANLAVAGVQGFVADSLAQIEQICRIVPGAVVIDATVRRDAAHVTRAVALGVGRFRVAGLSDLTLLNGTLPQGAEVVLPEGAGAVLARAVLAQGFAVGLSVKIGEIAAAVRAAGVAPAHLYLAGAVTECALAAEMIEAFGANPPGMVCVPGQDAVNDAFVVALPQGNGAQQGYGVVPASAANKSAPVVTVMKLTG